MIKFKYGMMTEAFEWYTIPGEKQQQQSVNAIQAVCVRN